MVNQKRRNQKKRCNQSKTRLGSGVQNVPASTTPKTQEARVARVNTVETMNQSARTTKNITTASSTTPSSTRGKKSGVRSIIDAAAELQDTTLAYVTPAKAVEAKEDRQQQKD